MPTEEELFGAVDALLEDAGPQLPQPTERARLREAAGITQARLAQVLQSTTQTVKNWESGRSEPRPPRLQAYARLLEGWAARHPAPEPVLPATSAPSAPAVASAPEPPADAPPAPAPATSTAPAASPPSTMRRTPPGLHKPAAAKAAPVAVDARFPHGPLAVLDGEGAAYAVGGLVLECPAATLPQLVDWALSTSGLGAPRLHRNGRDSDPLIVLTAAAVERFGLPLSLRDDDEMKRSLRLPEDHKVVKQIIRAKWKLTQRGFGPWARIYRPATGGQRQCVQLAILPWDALDERAWGDTAQLPAPDLARVLGVYATRVITPRGSTAVSGLELMTALRPPTRAAKDDGGTWVSAPNPGALIGPVDPAPPEATLEHPVAQGWTKGFLDEEAYQWVRPLDTLTDAEMLLPWAVGIDINTAFLAAAARLTVGLAEPVQVDHPLFDKKIPGSWFVDLSHIGTDPRLPSPFTPSGKRPTGPAWYATPTVAYAVELGADVEPIEAYLRYETGPYLDPWHDRLKDAYVSLMADAGIPVDKDTDERRFLAAMAAHQVLKTSDTSLAKVRQALDAGADDASALRHLLLEAGLAHQSLPADLEAARLRHRQIAMVLSAVKSTVKGGIGKLRERPQGRLYVEGERWPALERPTWRPDIRAAVIAKARVNMHRKMANVAKASARYPLAVLSDCVVYASQTPDPLGFLPLTGAGKVLPGTFRLGATPGLAKLEGVQEMLWAVDLMERKLNPARHIKGGDAVMDEGE
ncbi:helix-turn-helix domain-containing protein [Streptacidiphilus sp. EB129]|uniref:telomere-associated protein Tap n=1 Tax=Streptacidiphilus sp. EB129 TaxID=3156262 RepID=UPI00351244A5